MGGELQLLPFEQPVRFAAVFLFGPGLIALGVTGKYLFLVTAFGVGLMVVDGTFMLMRWKRSHEERLVVNMASPGQRVGILGPGGTVKLGSLQAFRWTINAQASKGGAIDCAARCPL